EVQNRNQKVRQGTEKRIHGSDQVINALVHLTGVASLYIASVEVSEKNKESALRLGRCWCPRGQNSRYFVERERLQTLIHAAVSDSR
ncbi:hypothetical protein P692DRAFT_20748648, partial [Suillus brevipes Sb2]